MENPQEKPSQFDLNRFLESSEIQQKINKLIELWEKYIDVKERIAKRASNRFLIIALTSFTLIIVAVIWLTLAKSISSEDTAFLLGVIITGAISIIRDFTGGR